MSQLLRFIHATAPGVGTDRELLDRFTRDRDEDAFAAIVRRYGGAVWAACHRLAGRNAEDAFQAVFLTLARKAASVSGSLPAWLREVTRRVAANLRRDAHRRAAVETAAAHHAEARPDDVTLDEGLAILDEELARLPERYRAVLIVCCLEGRSRDEAAGQLGWSEGQVKGRLERAREMLRKRLGRRGIELGGILLAATLTKAAPAAPAIPSAAILSAGHAVSPVVVSLTNGVIHAMLLQKIKIVAIVLLMTAVAGAVTYRTAVGGTGATDNTPAKTAARTSAEEPPVKELNRWEKLLRDKKLTVKERAAYEQIAKLHTVKLKSVDWGILPIPSFPQDSKLSTDVLYAMGVDALPMLAEALDDDTPTATVTVQREGNFKQEKVWKVNEFVALLIIRIADRDFVIGEPLKEISIRDIAQQPKAASEFRKLVVNWYGKFATKTPTERKIADVTDDWFRNRFDAIIWLGGNRVKEGRAPIAARVDAFYADPKRESSSLTQTEMTYCALALAQIGDKASLPEVRRVCEDVSHTVYMCYRPSDQGRWGADSGINERLFRAYHGLALLGEKDGAVKELKRLLDVYGSEMEVSTRKDYEKRLTEAKDW